MLPGSTAASTEAAAEQPVTYAISASTGMALAFKDLPDGSRTAMNVPFLRIPKDDGPDTAATASTDANAAAAAAAAASAGTTVTPMAAGTTYQPNLDLHNTYRALHVDTPSMVWDDTVAASALSYASKCIWAHDSANDYGENLYASSQTSSNLAQDQLAGVKMWVSAQGLLGQALRLC